MAQPRWPSPKAPFATDARRELHKAGWTDSFARLASHLALPDRSGDRA
jgi:hypothetical protein